MHRRYGPKLAGGVGVGLTLLGYLLLWAGACKHIGHSAFEMGVYQYLWSYGSAVIDLTIVGVTIRNFPTNCASLVGLLKAFYGISGALVTRFYITWGYPVLILYALPFLVDSDVFPPSYRYCCPSSSSPPLFTSSAILPHRILRSPRLCLCVDLFTPTPSAAGSNQTRTLSCSSSLCSSPSLARSA